MAVDAFAKRKNPWSELFAVNRKKLKAGWDYLKENKDYPYYFAGLARKYGRNIVKSPQAERRKNPAAERQKSGRLSG